MYIYIYICMYIHWLGLLFHWLGEFLPDGEWPDVEMIT